MIVSLHVAVGAVAGAVTGSRPLALALGPVLHTLGDALPHEEIESRRFEIATGIASVSLLALTRGPLDPATLGGLAASAPDLEHVLPLWRPGGRPLFPSHRWPALHHSGGLPAWAQLLAAGALLGAVIACRSATPRQSCSES